MPVRLLFLTAETCPTFRPDVHVLFGKYLPRLGVRSDVVAGRSPEEDGPVAWGGGTAYLCNMRCGATRRHLRLFWHGLRILLVHARRPDYDAVQVRDLPLMAAIGLVVARARGLPFFYWMSYPIAEGQIALAQERRLSAGLMKFLFPWVSGRVGRFLLYRCVLPRANHVFVQSVQMRAELARRGVDAGRMTVVPMGVDVEEVRDRDVGPADDPRLAGKRVMVYLGTLDRPRRIEVLFQMMALLVERVPEALLVLVGDTADEVHRDWLRRQADAAGVAGAVIWTGWLPTLQAWRYVRSAELGISPIPRGPLLDVGSPTKVAEYLALGVPVLCNDNPDQEEIVRASGAGICAPYQPVPFADAAFAMLSESLGYGAKARSSGVEYISAHRSYGRLAARLAEVYHEWH